MFRPNQSTPDTVQNSDFLSILKKNLLTYETSWGWFALRSINEERLLRSTWNKLYLVASKYEPMQTFLCSDLTNGTCSGKQIWFPPCCRSSPSHPSLACAALISCSIPSLTTHTWTNKSPTSVLQFGLSENNTVHRRPRISSTLLERGGQEKEWRQR